MQQQLAFVATGPAPARRGKMEAEPTIFCSAPVATTQHRVLAASVDIGIVLFSVALLLGIMVVFAPGSLGQSYWSAGALGIMAALIAVLYQLLWVLGNGDSAGMRWARLRLVNFDGRRPARPERSLRMMGLWLSALPAALGLVWSLMDEENLTWHDHISKTFPTPTDALKE